MAAWKRTPDQREADLVELSAFIRRGGTALRFSLALGPGKQFDRAYTLSGQQCWCDLKELKRRWRLEAVSDMDAEVGRQLQEQDELRLQYEAAWERSCKPKQSTKSGKTKRNIGAGDLSVDSAEVRSEGRDGNPAFLQGKERAINRRAEILGLNASPELRVKLTGGGAKGEIETRHVLELGASPESYARGLSAIVALVRGEVEAPTNGNGAGGQH